ncbi:MAG: M20/M25/M40 family metallo-hydrolase [Anaerolineae bacterium]|nr:M20/M25/M40 family metallo-hydrolase [Anaerolineae bacterium]
MTKLRLTRDERAQLVAFLQDLVRIPSPPTQEGPLAERMAQEMERLGLREVRTDRIGNVLGWVGQGDGPVLMFNGHMDTVALTNPSAWRWDPFGGVVEGKYLYGLGSCDMKGGLAAIVYGAYLLRRTGLPKRGRVVVAGVVQEEPCEGLGSRVLIEEEGVRPDWVVIAEPTNLEVVRGQRGRIEIEVTVHGRTAHASRPDLGENAVSAAGAAGLRPGTSLQPTQQRPLPGGGKPRRD